MNFEISVNANTPRIKTCFNVDKEMPKWFHLPSSIHEQEHFFNIKDMLQSKTKIPTRCICFLEFQHIKRNCPQKYSVFIYNCYNWFECTWENSHRAVVSI